MKTKVLCRLIYIIPNSDFGLDSSSYSCSTPAWLSLQTREAVKINCISYILHLDMHLKHVVLGFLLPYNLVSSLTATVDAGKAWTLSLNTFLACGLI